MSEYVFPQDQNTGLMSDKFQRVGGMTLRDYFAAQALPAIQASGENLSQAAKGCAVVAYAIADAMLVARQLGPIFENEEKKAAE